MREAGPRRSIGRDITFWIAAALAVSLGGWRAVSVDDYWLNPDEGLYHEIASTTSAEQVERMIRSHPHPPLFYWALWSLEPAPDGADIGELRLPSVLLASLAILLAYWLGREVHDGWTGLALAGLVAVSPALGEQALVIRQYSWVLPCLLLATVGTIRGLRTGRTRWVLLAWSALALGLMVHYSAGVLAAGLLALTLVAGLWPRVEGRLRWSWLIALVPFAAAAGWVWEANLRPLLYKTDFLGSASASWLQDHFIRGVGSFLETTAGSYAYAFGREQLVAAVLLFAAGSICLWRRRLGWAAVVSLGVLVLVWLAAITQIYPFGATRHTSVWIPFLALPLAVALRELLGAGWRRAVPAAAVIAATVLLGGSLLGALGWTQRTGWLKAVPEQAIPRESIEKMSDALERLALRSAPVLTDQQTWAVVHPLIPLADRKQVEYRGEPGLRHVPWGTSDVIVVPNWVLTLMPDEANIQMTGVPGTLARAREAFPELFRFEEQPVFFLAAGWFQPWMFGFSRLKSAAGDRPLALKGMRHAQGIGLFRLDLGAYDNRGALLTAPRRE